MRRCFWTGVVLLAMAPLSICRAAIISFQQGASPSPAYNTDAVTIRSDVSGVNVNQNSNGQILVGNESTGGITNGRRRGLFEFNLSEIEAIAAGEAYVIEDVQLILRSATGGSNSTGSPVTYHLSRLGANLDFDEASVTWNNAPGGAGGSLGTLLSTLTFDPTSGEADRIFASTEAFKTAVTEALTNDAANTLRLVAHVAAGEGVTGLFNLARFQSDENSPASIRPKLIITYAIAPEPSLVGLLGLLWVPLTRRRRPPNDQFPVGCSMGPS